MTTGMSAPPMGTISSTPSSRAIAVMIRNGVQEGSMKKTTPKPIITMPSPRFTQCWPAKRIGLPDILPDSFRKAMMEPVKVIAPTKVPMNSSMRLLECSISPGSAMP